MCVHFGIVEMRGGDGLVIGRMKLDVWVHLLGFGFCGSSLCRVCYRVHMNLLLLYCMGNL